MIWKAPSSNKIKIFQANSKELPCHYYLWASEIDKKKIYRESGAVLVPRWADPGDRGRNFSPARTYVKRQKEHFLGTWHSGGASDKIGGYPQKSLALQIYSNSGQCRWILAFSSWFEVCCSLLATLRKGLRKPTWTPNVKNNSRLLSELWPFRRC